jgi:hypothetical protein
MSKVLPLIAFGFLFILGGSYWMLWDESMEYIEEFSLGDEYYELISFGWRMIPAVIIFVGIMCLITAGIKGTRNNDGVEY